jgi:hypothetical protein
VRPIRKEVLSRIPTTCVAFHPGTYANKYKFYDAQGRGFWDHGSGTHSNSDFHHNGDLVDYMDAFGNILGKIYGIMDDLRTESPRVRQKLIAMSTALSTPFIR